MTAELAASEVRYRRLFEAAQDGILIVEADSGLIVDVNPYLAQLLGYDRVDFLGRHIWDFGPFRDVVASKEAFELLQATEYIAYEDLPLEAKDGRRIDVGFVSNVYLEGSQRTIQCNIRDLTVRKAAERERASLEEQLRAAQKMEAIGRLAGGIAHDFNNLLSVILCYVDFALTALPADSVIREDLSEVQKASRLAAALTRQLLTFSRRQIVQPVALDLNETVSSLDHMLRRILREDIELVCVLEPALVTTMADPGQIEQVILNLVVNARDAMPNGGKVTIETENVELDAAGAALHVGLKPGAYVVLTITDTGSGMDAPTRARVFDPFFTTKPVGEGTGLGLSTVHGIVLQSGGDICVFTDPGLGTKFKIYLPRAPGDRLADAPAAEVTVRSTGTETILVVEDEEAIRRIAHRILVAAGYDVLTAADGREALSLCASHEGAIPLVVTDVVMPGMSGASFAEALRQVRPATSVLFMSGYSGEIEIGTDFIGKPFTAARLTTKVREMLDSATREAS